MFFGQFKFYKYKKGNLQTQTAKTKENLKRFPRISLKAKNPRKVTNR